jgi:hypothetical protein
MVTIEKASEMINRKENRSAALDLGLQPAKTTTLTCRPRHQADFSTQVGRRRVWTNHDVGRTEHRSRKD